MRIVSIVGARPQFVKAAILFRAIQEAGLTHRLIHTGQHYDARMSNVFFAEFGLTADRNLEVGSGPHGVQTGEIMKRLEPALLEERPDWVLLYGDTNSTLAGAIVAAKLGLPLAHVEAGLRSFNRAMPEEINRIVADRLSDLLFCPTESAMANLRNEGLERHGVFTGDVMYDAFLVFREAAQRQAPAWLERWQAGAFALATIHRAENTDDPVRLRSLLNALEEISGELCPVVLPLHPRTRKILLERGWQPKAVELIEPVSYLEMLQLETRARFIVTDSGGVQKEAYFAHVPCITVRDQTEWVETLCGGCNVLAGANQEAILAAARGISTAGPWTALYGLGDAGRKTVAALQG
jgi:UDP-GlcNAc3NAcA epimerase